MEKSPGILVTRTETKMPAQPFAYRAPTLHLLRRKSSLIHVIRRIGPTSSSKRLFDRTRLIDIHERPSVSQPTTGNDRIITAYKL